MTQLTVNGTDFPETSNDKYKCYPRDHGEALRMADLSLVFEKRGEVTVIEYSYDYPDGIRDGLMRQILTALRAPTCEVTYMPDDGGEVRTETFKCISLTSPSYAFSIPRVVYAEAKASGKPWDYEVPIPAKYVVATGWTKSEDYEDYLVVNVPYGELGIEVDNRFAEW